MEGTLNNNGTTRKRSQRYFCPAEYTLIQNLKLTLTLNLVVGLGLVLGLLSWLVLDFVVYSARQKYRWLIFLVVPI